MGKGGLEASLEEVLVALPTIHNRCKVTTTWLRLSAYPPGRLCMEDFIDMKYTP